MQNITNLLLKYISMRYFITILIIIFVHDVVF